MGYFNQDLFCPNCKPEFNRKGIQVGCWLELSESNYSGCEVDIVYCEKCNKYFQVSYKVDQITELNWPTD